MKYIIITDNSFDTDVKHFFKVGTEVVVERYKGLIKATKESGSFQFVREEDIVGVL